MANTLTREQRDWLENLRSFVGGPSEDLADANAEDVAVADDDAPDATTSDRRAPDKRLAGAPKDDASFAPELLSWAPVILNEIQKLGGGRRICAINVVKMFA